MREVSGSGVVQWWGAFILNNTMLEKVEKVEREYRENHHLIRSDALARNKCLGRLQIHFTSKRDTSSRREKTLYRASFPNFNRGGIRPVSRTGLLCVTRYGFEAARPSSLSTHPTGSIQPESQRGVSRVEASSQAGL